MRFTFILIPILGNTNCPFVYFHAAVTNLYAIPVGTCGSEDLKIFHPFDLGMHCFSYFESARILFAGSAWRLIFF
jgi:hypothetical protein